MGGTGAGILNFRAVTKPALLVSRNLLIRCLRGLLCVGSFEPSRRKGSVGDFILFLSLPLRPKATLPNCQSMVSRGYRTFLCAIIKESSSRHEG